MTTATVNPLRRDPYTVEEITIPLHAGDTPNPVCRDLPQREYGEGFYYAPKHPLSVATLPADGHAYLYGCSTVSRQNARHAANQGFRWQVIDRADFEDDLYRIRSSAPVRQGREMPPDYMTRQTYTSDAWPADSCPRHRATVHGVLKDDTLHGYMQVVQCGDVVRVNTILGHADQLEHRIMWLLMVEAIQWHIDEHAARFFLYYTHASGHGWGLRYFKERLGFRPVRVSWEF